MFPFALTVEPPATEARSAKRWLMVGTASSPTTSEAKSTAPRTLRRPMTATATTPITAATQALRVYVW